MSNIIKLQTDRILTGSKVIKPRIVEKPACEQDAVDPLVEAKVNELIMTAEAKAKDTVEKALQEAEQLRNDLQEEKNLWEAEKKQLSEEAWREGYQKGLEEGRTAGEQEYKSLIDTAIGTINSAKEDTKAYIVQSERTILDLAMASAESILESAISEEPEKFIGVVKKALNELKNEKQIEIYVHPTKFQLLVSSRNVLESVFPREVQCYIYPNEEINENGCVVECETIRIESGIDSQLSELKERLAELLTAEQEE